MLIPKKSRITVYSYLFKEGVMVAKKEYNMNKHADVDVPNLWVLKLMQSLKSNDYVREKFNWQYFYWYLTNEGIEYLRDYLNLPREIVPATLKKTRTPAGTRPRGFGGDRERGDRGERGGDRGDRGDRGSDRGDRRSFPSDDKKLGGAERDFAPRFNREGGRGGFGRGGDRGSSPFGGDRSGFGRDPPFGGDRERGGFGGDRGGFGRGGSDRGGGDRGGRQQYRREGDREGGRGGGFGRGGGGFGSDRGGFGGGDRGARQGGGFGRGQNF